MNAAKMLADAGLRVTPQRLAILAQLQATVSHPSAQCLYEQLRDKFPSLSPATVYKTLALLVEKGLIQVLQVEDDRLHYDANAADHPHIVCTGCDKVEDVHYLEPNQGFQAVANSTGYRVLREKKIYYGLCPRCQQNPH